MHDLDWKTEGMNQLLEDVRQRQRNFVFPDTVRNEGHFFRSLGSGSYDRNSPLRVIAAIFGIFLLFEYVLAALMFLPSGIVLALVEFLLFGSLGAIVAIKIIFNAAFDRPADPPPEFITRRKKLMGRR